MTMGEEEKINRELESLNKEHSELKNKIDNITSESSFDQLMLQRLKRRKLWVKDRITELQNLLCDDIIA